MPPTTRHTCWQGPLSEGKFLQSEHISPPPPPPTILPIPQLCDVGGGLHCRPSEAEVWKDENPVPLPFHRVPRRWFQSQLALGTIFRVSPTHHSDAKPFLEY